MADTSGGAMASLAPTATAAVASIDISIAIATPPPAPITVVVAASSAAPKLVRELSTRSRAIVHLNEFDEPIMVAIFQFLPYDDLALLAAVNKRWGAVSLRSSLWHKVFDCAVPLFLGDSFKRLCNPPLLRPKPPKPASALNAPLADVKHESSPASAEEPKPAESSAAAAAVAALLPPLLRLDSGWLLNHTRHLMETYKSVWIERYRPSRGQPAALTRSKALPPATRMMDYDYADSNNSAAAASPVANPLPAIAAASSSAVKWVGDIASEQKSQPPTAGAAIELSAAANSTRTPTAAVVATPPPPLPARGSAHSLRMSVTSGGSNSPRANAIAAAAAASPASPSSATSAGSVSAGLSPSSIAPAVAVVVAVPSAGAGGGGGVTTRLPHPVTERKANSMTKAKVRAATAAKRRFYCAIKLEVHEIARKRVRQAEWTVMSSQKASETEMLRVDCNYEMRYRYGSRCGFFGCIAWLVFLIVFGLRIDGYGSNGMTWFATLSPLLALSVAIVGYVLIGVCRSIHTFDDLIYPESMGGPIPSETPRWCVIVSNHALAVCCAVSFLWSICGLALKLDGYLSDDVSWVVVVLPLAASLLLASLFLVFLWMTALCEKCFDRTYHDLSDIWRGIHGDRSMRSSIPPRTMLVLTPGLFLSGIEVLLIAAKCDGTLTGAVSWGVVFLPFWLLHVWVGCLLYWIRRDEPQELEGSSVVTICSFVPLPQIVFQILLVLKLSGSLHALSYLTLFIPMFILYGMLIFSPFLNWIIHWIRNPGYAERPQM